MAKNAGKTECLNYILNGVKNSGKRIAVTSIGVDGESFDRTNKFPKPEIEIFEGMIFVTSETHYRQKQLIAEILDINENRTSLGRLVIAKALSQGKVLLSGPADTKTLKILIESLQKFDIDTVIIDTVIISKSLLTHLSSSTLHCGRRLYSRRLFFSMPLLYREMS